MIGVLNPHPNRPATYLPPTHGLFPRVHTNPPTPPLPKTHWISNPWPPLQQKRPKPFLDFPCFPPTILPVPGGLKKKRILGEGPWKGFVPPYAKILFFFFFPKIQTDSRSLKLSPPFLSSKPPGGEGGNKKKNI